MAPAARHNNVSTPAAVAAAGELAQASSLLAAGAPAAAHGAGGRAGRLGDDVGAAAARGPGLDVWRWSSQPKREG